MGKVRSLSEAPKRCAIRVGTLSLTLRIYKLECSSLARLLGLVWCLPLNANFKRETEVKTFFGPIGKRSTGLKKLVRKNTIAYFDEEYLTLFIENINGVFAK
jgi:hypothetical protein